MMTTSFRTRALTCALLASTAYCSLAAQPAQAQAAPPAFRHLDSNGVDLVQGDFVRAFAEGSIGAGDAELALMRLVGNVGPRGGSQWDNIYMSASSNGDRFVAFGPRQDKFPGAESRGATLSGGGSNYVYRAPDGTQIEFGLGGAETGEISNLCLDGAGQSFCNLIPTSITSPAGKVVTLEYEFWNNCVQQQSPEDPLDCTSYWRLARVSNSFGYAIAFSYAAAAGAGHANPPAGFYQCTGAAFYNETAGSSALAGVGYSYPSAGVTEITDQGGLLWRVTSTGTLYAIRRPGASADTTSATRSSTTGLVTQVTEEGVTTGYSRSVNTTTNVATMTVTQVDPGGPDPMTTIVSDLTAGRPTLVTDPLGHDTAYDYDSSGRLTRVTRDEGDYVQYTYDSRGNVAETRLRDKSGNSANDIVTAASYDSTCSNPVTCNSPNSVTDARGNTADYTYDALHGGVLTATGPAPTSGAVRPQTRYAYTLANGEYRLTGISQCRTGSAPSCVGTADEAKAAIAYDSNGNVASTSAGSGDGALTATSAMTYDSLGNLLTVDGPLPGTADASRIRYNSARQVVGTISPDPDGAGALKPRAVRNSYTDGLLTKVEAGTVNSQSDSDWAAFAPAQAVETDYDEGARPVKRKLVSGGTIYALSQTSYDALGRPECVAQRMNIVNFATLTTAACSLGTEGSYGPDRIARTFYDAAGQVTKVQSAVGTSDQADEVTTTYTDNGLVETVTDAEDNKTTYEYDGHDRLAKTRFPGTTKGAGTSSATDYEQLGYDANGNVTSFRNRANQTLGFTFDALGRLTLKDLPGSEPDVAYAYDLLGRMTSAATSAQTLSFAWDALGRNLSQTDGSRTYSSTYDLAGRRTRITHPDGFFVQQDYLVTGEMTTIRERDGTTDDPVTSGVGVLATYGYDDLGRRSSLTYGNGESASYSYDAVSRLHTLSHDLGGSATTNDVTFTYAYNPASQIVSTVRSNNLYAWTGHGNGTTSTTANGLNQIAGWNGTLTYDAKGNMTSDGTRTYSYDSENRLSLPGTTTPYHYDPLGRLAGAGSPLVVQYDNYIDGLIAEKSPSNSNITYRHVFGPGTDEPIVWYSGSGTTDRRFLHADERGSIVAVTDSSANLLAINRYDEYGKTQTSNATYLGRFLYTGQRYFAASGLYYYKARFYHPAVGRFMQTDRTEYDDGMNVYAYVGGDPINATDPSGTCDEIVLAHGGDCGESTAEGWVDKKVSEGSLFFRSEAAMNDFIWRVTRYLRYEVDLLAVKSAYASQAYWSAFGASMELSPTLASQTYLQAPPTDSEGYTDIFSFTMERGLGAEINETVVVGLSDIKLLSHFSTVIQCNRCLAPLFGGSYDVRFLDPARRQVGGIQSVVGRIGLVGETKMSVPVRAYFMLFVPTILTPPSTQVVVRGIRRRGW
jgi:RHS repeat-associated protein